MGKTLGIIGLGSIGVKVANAAISLGMSVVGYDPTISVHRAWELSSTVKQAHSVDELLIDADFVSFHVPLTETTKNMINGSRLQLMKNGVVLLNFSRDGIIDDAALAEAVNEGKVRAYVTDFPCAALQPHPRIICLPHLGASTQEAEENCAVMLARQVRHFLETGSVCNAVNFPAIEIPPIHSGVRLAIVNENVPNMVAQISSQLASAGLNIVSLLNKSLNNIAYTVIDVNNEITTALLNQMTHIEGVMQVRTIS